MVPPDHAAERRRLQPWRQLRAGIVVRVVNLQALRDAGGPRAGERIFEGRRLELAEAGQPLAAQRGVGHDAADHVADGQQQYREEKKRQHADEDVAEEEAASNAPEQLAQHPADENREAVERQRDEEQRRQEGNEAENAESGNVERPEDARDDGIENDDGQSGGPDRKKPRAAALAREFGLLLDGQHT